MDSEKSILKIVWDKGSKAHIGAIAREAGFGIDYTRYLLSGLTKNRLVVQPQGKSLYKVTRGGQRKLGLAVAKRKKLVVAASHRLNIELEEEAPIVEESPKVILVHNLASNAEEKLNIWSKIKKAAGYLSELPQKN